MMQKNSSQEIQGLEMLKLITFSKIQHKSQEIQGTVIIDFFNFLISLAFGALNSERQEITNPELWVE